MWPFQRGEKPVPTVESLHTIHYKRSSAAPRELVPFHQATQRATAVGTACPEPPGVCQQDANAEVSKKQNDGRPTYCAFPDALPELFTNLNLSPSAALPEQPLISKFMANAKEALEPFGGCVDTHDSHASVLLKQREKATGLQAPHYTPKASLAPPSSVTLTDQSPADSVARSSVAPRKLVSSYRVTHRPTALGIACPEPPGVCQQDADAAVSKKQNDELPSHRDTVKANVQEAPKPFRGRVDTHASNASVVLKQRGEASGLQGPHYTPQVSRAPLSGVVLPKLGGAVAVSGLDGVCRTIHESKQFATQAAQVPRERADDLSRSSEWPAECDTPLGAGGVRDYPKPSLPPGGITEVPQAWAFEGSLFEESSR